MAHTHSVVDNDTRFKVEAVSREIRADTKSVKSLQQYDHNSEVLTFEAPRYIEGHDLMSCNVVQIHYANIYSDLTTRTEAVKKGVYTVKDLAVDAKNEDLVVFSWVVEAGSTQLVGALNFVISFVCTDENGEVVYRWSTALCKLLSVDESLNNSDEIAEKYPDVIADLEARVKAIEENGGSGTTDYTDLENKPKINGVELNGNLTTADLGIKDGKDGQNGKDGENGKDGQDYVLTDEDKQEIAQIAISLIPTTEGVEY